jgi:hypothetical protein
MRHDEFGSKGHESIAVYLASDQRRIDELLADVCDAVVSGAMSAARSRFEVFGERLRRHIRLAESIVLPLYQERTGLLVEPQQLRAGHRLIERLAAAVAVALDEEDGAAFTRALEALVSALGDHNRKEERVLHLAADVRVDEGRLTALAHELRHH